MKRNFGTPMIRLVPTIAYEQGETNTPGANWKIRSTTQKEIIAIQSSHRTAALRAQHTSRQLAKLLTKKF